jgi:ubiquinone/menaquinone biosynthesis C-methylase UbiE
MRAANKELRRVLKDGGTLILKIMGEQNKIYLELLTNFIFYLTIQTVRAVGFIKTKPMKNGAVWWIGIAKSLCYSEIKK